MLGRISSSLNRVSPLSITSRLLSTSYNGKQSLSEVDPEIWSLILKEKQRQIEGLELIASENFASKAVLEANGSCLTNKYSEGYPAARYYGGNNIIDQVEKLCQQRALEAFRLDPAKWAVNVQPLSGSPANLAVYVGLLNPHDRLMGLDLPHGGHLTHGYMTPSKRISATSIFFESMPYRLDSETGYIDYDGLAASVILFKPKLIIAGATAYPREYDYARMREIADSVGAYLMGDMAHISGMVCAGVMKNNPFDYCDVITSTTHKTLRGPRAGIIFSRKGTREITSPAGKVTKSEYNIEERINNSVFPALQGGPHEHTIAGIAVALKEAMSPAFKEYQSQVLKNAKVLGSSLISRGYKLVSDGTDNHMILVDLHPQNIDGSRVEKVLEACGITVNKNSVPGDTKPMVPGGLRIGTPALTTRGMKEMDFEAVAEFLHRGIRLAMQLNTEGENATKLKVFSDAVKTAIERPEWQQLKNDVETLSRKFNMPGHESH